MDFIKRLLAIFIQAAGQSMKEEIGSSKGRKRSSSRSSSHSSSSSRSSHTARTSSTSAAQTSGKGNKVWDVRAHGLPPFQYEPNPDGDADPGEVVWTWVSYEEDPSQGKDRPVVVLSRVQQGLVVAQLTSKDHRKDAEQEAHWGRYWFPIGTGAWDPQGRPSQVRLDRLLIVAPGDVRREGATVDHSTYNAVCDALRQHWNA